MLNDLAGHGHMCPMCGNHEPFRHAPGAGDRGAGAPGARAPMPGTGETGTKDSAGTDPTGARQGALDAGFRAPTLSSLASIMCLVYRGQGVTELFRSSGLPPVWNHLGQDWAFLRGALEGTQRDFGPYGVAKILETACAHQDSLGNGEMRVDINECLSPFGVRIGDDCRARRLGQAEPPAGEADPFDQRNYHPAIMEHAKPKYLKGEHFASVVEGCKVLEKLVSAQSGIDDYGASLMKRALGDGGILEVEMADLTGRTRDGIRRGLGSMCEGVVSGVRNPASHEYEQRFPIDGEDALDILSVISYLCRQIEKMRRRTGPRP